MSASKILIAAAVAAIMTTFVSCMPTSDEKIQKILALNEVLNQTVCPIRVELDVVENRVPRVIKMLKCAAEPDHCKQQGHTSHDCCESHKNDNYHMECVEITDTVKVGIRINKNEFDSTTQVVAVGCSCMYQKIGKSKAIPGQSTPSAKR